MFYKNIHFIILIIIIFVSIVIPSEKITKIEEIFENRINIGGLFEHSEKAEW